MDRLIHYIEYQRAKRRMNKLFSGACNAAICALKRVRIEWHLIIALGEILIGLFGGHLL